MTALPERYVCIHGHFYQPPRENPWLEEVEMQQSASPFHDWNLRVDFECYAPNSSSRILTPDGRIADIVNNYSWMSFDFGPTLLRWMERHDPETYGAILAADRLSAERFSGHGSAMAQVYNHMIMPLADRRDKVTQVRWGVQDFRRRFGRMPEGMWLPETAVDLETLDIMAEEGIRFTILAPHQASRFRRDGEACWTDASGGRIDPRLAYFCRLPSGRTISLFFYDGPISHDVAFGGLLGSGVEFANRLLGAFTGRPSELVHIATDGETYGHHHRFGDMALAYCLHHIRANRLARITNYGEFLEVSPPRHEVQIMENTSWSCSHGVERWRGNCGDNAGTPGWNQEWRGPLREAMDWLRDAVAPLYEREASRYLQDPWGARDDYIRVVLDRSPENVDAFLSRHERSPLSIDEKRLVLKLLEMQRHSLLAFTSCGWFFDDISGIEATQVMSYASRAIQLAHEVFGVDLERPFLEILGRARSNIAAVGTGADAYAMFVKPSSADLVKVGAHHAIASLFNGGSEQPLGPYQIEYGRYGVHQSGRLKLAIGESRILSRTTLEEAAISFAVLWLGDHNVYAGVGRLADGEALAKMQERVKKDFRKANVREMISLIDSTFGEGCYTLKDLFRDKQAEIMGLILKAAVEGAETGYRRVFDDNYSALIFLRDIALTPPKAILSAAEVVLNSEMRRALTSEQTDLEHLGRLVDDILSLSVQLDGDLAFEAGSKVQRELEGAAADTGDAAKLEMAARLVAVLKRLPLQLNLWRSQNTAFLMGREHYATMSERCGGGDGEACRWLAAFDKLVDQLGIKIQR